MKNTVYGRVHLLDNSEEREALLASFKASVTVQAQTEYQALASEILHRPNRHAYTSRYLEQSAWDEKCTFEAVMTSARKPDEGRESVNSTPETRLSWIFGSSG